MKKTKILFGLTGSIACFKSCQLISTLVKSGYEVQVVATSSALKFVGEATLEGLTGRPVLSDSFTRGHAMDHIELARWADLFIVAPLTAHHAALFANGFGEDLLSTLFLAYESHKPLILAPAMNVVMWQSHAVQDNFAKLRARGIELCEPASGRLACGEEGLGKMREPDELMALIEQLLHTQTLSSTKNILVTYGGTREMIDGVRAITNLSTGATGALICDELLRAGFNVTALAAATAKSPVNSAHAHLHMRTFNSHADLAEVLRTTLHEKHFDFVIHLAAISDYSVSRVVVDGVDTKNFAQAKINSDKEISISLKPTSKLVNSLKEYALEPKPQIVAFKLTNSSSATERKSAIDKLLSRIGIDYVVHNDETEIDRATNKHSFKLFSKHSGPKDFSDVRSLAQGLVQIAQGGREHDSLS
jgi:phosphopantothenoylcysteine decarboxylase / phosphopantothenate---cysteine ligase